MVKYDDATQDIIEGGLLNAFSRYPTLRVDDEQIVGATMLRHNIFYDEAKARVAQALRTLKGAQKRRARRVKWTNG